MEGQDETGGRRETLNEEEESAELANGLSHRAILLCEGVGGVDQDRHRRRGRVWRESSVWSNLKLTRDRVHDDKAVFTSSTGSLNWV